MVECPGRRRSSGCRRLSSLSYRPNRAPRNGLMMMMMRALLAKQQMTNANVEKNDKERKNTTDTNHTPKLTITKIEISIGE